MAKSNLKLAASRDLAREALAAAIAQHRRATQRIADNAAQVARLSQRAYEANDAIDAAQAAAEEAERAAALHIADPSKPPPAMKPREARQALADAEETRTVLRAARDAAERASSDLEVSARITESGLRAAVSEVVRHSPATLALIGAYRERLRELVDLRRVLEFIDHWDGIPPEHRHWRSEPEGAGQSTVAHWQAALTSLETDADAALPEGAP